MLSKEASRFISFLLITEHLIQENMIPYFQISCSGETCMFSPTKLFHVNLLIIALLYHITIIQLY